MELRCHQFGGREEEKSRCLTMVAMVLSKEFEFLK